MAVRHKEFLLGRYKKLIVKKRRKRMHISRGISVNYFLYEMYFSANTPMNSV